MAFPPVHYNKNRFSTKHVFPLSSSKIYAFFSSPQIWALVICPASIPPALRPENCPKMNTFCPIAGHFSAAFSSFFLPASGDTIWHAICNMNHP
jgi:hypothetical protein